MSFFTPFAFVKTTASIPTIITTNLAQWLDANNAASNPGSGTTWNDISGNSRNATLINGASFATDGSIKYVNLDGVNDYVDAGDFLSATYNPFSVQMWVWNDNVSVKTTYSAKWDDTGNNRQWIIITNPFNEPSGFNNTVGWLLDATGNFSTVIFKDNATSFPTSTWTNLAFTYNNQVGKFYKNGVEVSSETFPSTQNLTNKTSPIQLGRNGQGNYLQGRFGQHLYYNAALTADEVLYNYNISKGDYGL